MWWLMGDTDCYRPWQFWLICQITMTCLKTWTHLAMILCQCDLDIPSWFLFVYDTACPIETPILKGISHDRALFGELNIEILRVVQEWFEILMLLPNTIAWIQGIMFASSHLTKKTWSGIPKGSPCPSRFYPISVFSVPWSSIHRDWYSHKDSLCGMTMPDISDIPLVTWPSHMNVQFVGPPFMIAKLLQIISITIVYDTYWYL